MTGAFVTGIIHVVGKNAMFIERDDGVSPNIFLHAITAERGGLVPPYDGQSVFCEVVCDGRGNCAALSVAAVPARGFRRMPLPVDNEISGEGIGYRSHASRTSPVSAYLSISPFHVSRLVAYGYLDEHDRGDPMAISDAISEVLRRALSSRGVALPARGAPPGNGAA